MPVQLATLTGVAPYHVERALKDLVRQGNDSESKVSSLATRIASLPRVPTMAQIAAALSATGSNPLNVTGLLPAGTSTPSSTIVTTPGGGGHASINIGLFSQRPPIAQAPSGTVFAASDRGYQTWVSTGAVWLLLPGWGGPMAGTVFTPNARPAGLTPNDAGFRYEGTDANDAIWTWNGTGYTYTVGTGFPYEVTLSPPTFPTLTINDAGFPIWATDFHRLYYWNGSAWVEGQHNDPRNMTVAFQSPGPDQNGWLLCNGAQGLASTSSAGTVLVTTPVLPNYYLRV